MSKLIGLQKDNILIHFDDIIKMPGLFILKTIHKFYKKEFSSFLDMEFLDTISDKDLEYIYISRNIQNPFEWLQKNEFDIETNYNYFMKKYKDMYLSLNVLPLIEVVNNLILSYQIENIYIYSKEYDERIAYEITRLFKSDDKNRKIQYITGNFEKCINMFKPRIVFYPYIEDTYEIAKEHKKTIFAIPEYGFNIDKDGKLIGVNNESDNFASYPIYKKKHYFG